MHERLLVAVEHGLGAELERLGGPERDFLHRWLAGRAKHLLGLGGGVRALRELGLFRRKFHREREAGVRAAFLAVGFRQKFLDLETGQRHGMPHEIG